MKIYRLSPISDAIRNTYWGYDCFDSFVVRAKSEEKARLIAQKNGADEIKNSFYEEISIWTNPEITSCKIIEKYGDEEIICSSFNAG